jgi:hypothetical protein
MNIRINKVVKFIIGFGGTLTLISVLFFIKEKYSEDTQTNSEITDTSVVSSNKPLQADKDFMNKTERTDNTSYHEQTYSELLKKVKEMESTIADLKVEKSSTDYTELNSKIKEMESTIADLRAEKSSADYAYRYSDVSRDDVEYTSELEEEKEKEEDIVAEYRARTDVIEQTLYSEYVDPEWADWAVNEIYESMLDTDAEDIEILTADCGSTLCRVELALNPETVEDSLAKLQTSIPWGGAVIIKMENISSGEAVAYIARKDHTLPRVSEY